jgi:hypothetical protein
VSAARIHKLALTSSDLTPRIGSCLAHGDLEHAAQVSLFALEGSSDQEEHYGGSNTLHFVIKFDTIRFRMAVPKRRWPIEFLRLADNSEPLRRWLDDLPDEVRGKVLARIDLMAEHGPSLDYPYTSQIEGPLRELRLRFGETRYRVLYFFDENRAGVLPTGSRRIRQVLKRQTRRLPKLGSNSITSDSRSRSHSRNRIRSVEISTSVRK